MNNRLFIIAVTALSFTAITGSAQQIPTTLPSKKITWYESGANYLRAAHATERKWQRTPISGHTSDTSQQVIADPATTSFVAMALLEAGGPLPMNPHSANILQALEDILQAIRKRPGNGSLTPLPLTALQQQLGVQVDVCMTLDFLMAMQKQLSEDLRIPASADICLALLENTQRSTPQHSQYRQHMQLRNESLAFTARMYYSADAVAIPDEKPHAPDFLAKSIRVIGDAGIALCRAATLAESTDDNTKQFDDVLRGMSFDAIYSLVTTGIDALATGMEIRSKARQDARQIANACLANALHSNSLEKEDYNSWIQWRREIETDFETTQNANGSWNGQHCTHDSAICTAAVLLAWHGDPGVADLSAKR